MTLTGNQSTVFKKACEHIIESKLFTLGRLRDLRQYEVNLYKIVVFLYVWLLDVSISSLLYAHIDRWIDRGIVDKWHVDKKKECIFKD